MNKNKGKQMKKVERKLEKRDRGNFDLKAIMCDYHSAFSHFRIGIFTLTPTGLKEISSCPWGFMSTNRTQFSSAYVSLYK